MRISILTFLLLLSYNFCIAQCPDLLQAMVNSCGTSEGNNEFVVFTTNATANASAYTVNYGSTNPPTVNNLAGSDATAKTGTGSINSTGCAVITVTNPSTSIPSGSRVIFISANLDQQYDVTGLCDGIHPLYVVYIKTNSNGGSNSNWSTGGTISNSATTPRYLQVTYNGNANCNSTNAPVKTYTASGNWPLLSGTMADGNFITWNGNTALYGNNGCTNIIVPVTLLNVYASFNNGSNIIDWQTSQEMNTSSFVVEKSYDAVNFTSAGSVPAAGYSNTLQSYRFTDHQTDYRTTYYRIKTIDRDGSFSVSKIVKLHPSNNIFTISNTYPNPASGTLFIEYNSLQKQHVDLMIIDMNGRTVLKQENNAAVGFNKTGVNVAALPRGRYAVKLMSDTHLAISSFTR